MPHNLAQKIIREHLVEGSPVVGEEIAIRIDQTLTQDSTGTLAYLEFEQLDIPGVLTKLSVSYVDHNTLQVGFENADDHLFLQSSAAKYGVLFSKPGNGICHQIHLERFGAPGQTLLGSDSHTPTCGALGMLAMGVGGMDVAMAMAGEPFYFAVPRVVLVKLTGKLMPWVSAKDVILELLRTVTVKGGVGKIFEYGGEGVKNLSVPERATIANMGAETGCITSLFPSDENTYRFLQAQKREKEFIPLQSDTGADYDEVIEIDMSTLESMVAMPHMPDNVCKVSEIAGIKIHQVAIGSCTNSSYKDLMTVSYILKEKKVHPDVSLVISPGSRQVLSMLLKNGAYMDLIKAGARVLEPACGPCIGMGQAPPTGGTSLRTFNRNFEGRCGTKDAGVYLAGPEVAAASAVTGEITDPRNMGDPIQIEMPREFMIDDSMIIHPSPTPEKIEIVRGPNIRALPVQRPVRNEIEGKILIKLGDNITTDHILPAGAKIMALRSNIAVISQYVFSGVDPAFYKKAQDFQGGIIVGGANYGQGSSREHAALAPMSLGIKGVIAKSFARIHRSNLINFGIVPMIFSNEEDYQQLEINDEVFVSNLVDTLKDGRVVTVYNRTKEYSFPVIIDLCERERSILLEGGLLNHTKRKRGQRKPC
jgi:aconitate hydratase